MTKDTLPSSAAMRRKLITGVAAMGTTLASRTIAPAATLLISAGSATAQAADPYAHPYVELCTAERMAYCDSVGLQPCSPGEKAGIINEDCGPEIFVVPPSDDEGSDYEYNGDDLIFGSNWIEPASWNTDPAAWIKPKNS